MKFLWAPWRMDYILEKKKEGCLFCKKPLEHRDRENLILCGGRYSFVMMNRFPYNNGHLMVVPNRHVFDFEKLSDNEMKELFHLLKKTTQVLRDTLHPHGFNIGFNIGKVGGAGEDHLHAHVVPRWRGDTNFMPILGETKIIPQYLEETYQTLHVGFRNHLKKGIVRKGVKRP
ncbi:MAG: HIT family hydrolase [Deltaproteobacteria bacterium RBG_16_48_10]|nr:MAG: HIT family hydrolase [Deltaproteobacteria bacterium RBG_16_48_10]